MSSKDYYKILGVEKNATREAIKDAYRKLAFQYHPDRNNGDDAATQKMKDVNEAYAVLSDPAKRKQYDLMGSQYGASAYDHFRRSYSTEDIFRGSDIDQVFEEFARAFGFRSSGDIFRGMYGTGNQTRPGTSGRTFFYRAGTPGGQGNAGGPVSGMPKGLTGKVVRFFVKRLTGVEMPENGEDRLDTLVLNPEEARAGGEMKHTYRDWGSSRNFMVKVPAGIREGQRIRLKGMGTPGKAGGQPGDLYLQVKIRKSIGEKFKGLFGGKPSG